MSIDQWIGALQLGLVFSVLAMGVYISFRILDFPDLTVDGAFPFGAAVSTVLLLKKVDPILALLGAFSAGVAAGYFTAFLCARLKILNLLAGILTMTALYSVNLRVMGGKPNLSLFGEQTLFSFVGVSDPEWGRVALLGIIVAFLLLSLQWFFHTEIGLSLRAAGNNPRMAAAQGISVARSIALGMSLSNGLAALAGGIFSQLFEFADITMGVGTIIGGLASLMIGEAILPGRSIFLRFVGTILGAGVYRLAIAFALNWDGAGLQASDLNLLTALIVVLAVCVPQLKKILGAFFRYGLRGIE